MSFASAPSPSAWFERAVEGDDVAIRVVGGIETRATTFMDAVREMAAADARAAMAMRETTSLSPVAVARSDAGTGTERVETRNAGAQAESACDECRRRERELRDAKRALLECRQASRTKRNKSGVVYGVRARPVVGMQTVEVTRNVVVAAPESTKVNRATPRRDGGEREVDVGALDVARSMNERQKKRHAARTAVLAKRSRERRAAKLKIVKRSATSPPPRRANEKPDWNDSIDVNAEPRKRTDDEYFDRLHRLVVAKEAEEAREKLRALQRKRRRWRRIEEDAMKRREQSTSSETTSLPERTPRVSVASSSSFQSAVDDACADMSELSLEESVERAGALLCC